MTSFTSSDNKASMNNPDPEKPEIPNAETIAAMEEGERIARDPNVKGYTVEEFFEEVKRW